MTRYNNPNAGIKLFFINYRLPDYLVFTPVKNLIPCFLAFWNTSGYFNSYLPCIH